MASWRIEQPKPPLERPIVKPGMPWWSTAVTAGALPVGAAGAAFWGLVSTIFVAGIVLVVVPSGLAKAAGVILLGALSGCVILAMRRARTGVVSSRDPYLDGVRIDGRGLELLADIQARFDYAQGQVRRIPTGIEWTEISDDVDVLLWEAATGAARMSELDQELHEVRYAAPGTPQAAYQRQLQERREEHEHLLEVVQADAEDLARRAGNAAAAAHLALVRTGDLRRLEVVVPTRDALRAQDALEQVKGRLDLLATVWAELDPGGAAQTEALRDRDQR